MKGKGLQCEERESQDDVCGRQEAWVGGNQRGRCEQAKGGHR